MKNKEIDLLRPQIRFAAYWTFILLGIAVAAWGALIPYIKENLAISEGILGLLLLCVGLGALSAMPFAGGLSSRFGCRRILQLAIPMFFILLVLVSITKNIWLCAILLFMLGMMSGITDIVVNIQAVIIENAYPKKLMSAMHGMYSLGNILGALSMIALLSLNLSPFLSTIILTCLAIGIVFFYCSPHLLPFASKKNDNAKFVIPRGIVLVVGSLCFLLYMSEGVVLDWAAIFLISQRQVDPAQASMAFVFFATTMTIGRLVGDRLIHEFGVRKVLIYGLILAALGQIIVLIGDSSTLSIMGFACTGLGLANAVPQLFSFAAKQDEVPVHIAISTVTILGFTGVLIGPAVMGFVAELTDISAVFALVGIILLFIGVVIHFIFKK